MLTFDQAVNLIYELPKFATTHTIEEGQAFLDALGHPEKGMRILHVAGTNGKGSVCIYMESILMHAGYKTGCFVSPHLVDMRERVRICGHMCDRDDFASAVDTVNSVAKRLFYPNFFEFVFFVGLLIFAKNNVNILILETGLGGRLDATNMLLEKELTVITSIGRDHCEYLGQTLAQIAREKAGIMRSNVPVVYWQEVTGDKTTDSEALEVLHECAVSQKTVEYALPSDMISDVFVDITGIDFCLKYKYDNYICLSMPTRALYQVKNAALAVISLMIWDKEETISSEHIKNALTDAFWEGRMEEILPGIILDGAHNEPGTRAFLESVKLDWAERRMLIYGCMSDKEYTEEIKLIADSKLFDKVVAVAPFGVRALPAEKLCEVMTAMGISAHANLDLESAIEEAKDFASRDGQIAYIAGSLYLIGEVRGLIP